MTLIAQELATYLSDKETLEKLIPVFIISFLLKKGRVDRFWHDVCLIICKFALCPYENRQ